MDYHLDFTKGNAAKFLFLWTFIEENLNNVADITTKTNLAIQATKTDKPTFALDFLRKQRAEWRQFRAQLNLWLQRNQGEGPNISPLFHAINAFRDNTTITPEEMVAAKQTFTNLITTVEEREQQRQAEEQAEEEITAFLNELQRRRDAAPLMDTETTVFRRVAQRGEDTVDRLQPPQQGTLWAGP